MTAETDWLDANNEYLAASLAWLRLRLQRLARPAPAKPKAPATSVIVTPVAIPALPTTAPATPPAAGHAWFRAVPATTALAAVQPASEVAMPSEVAAPPEPAAADPSDEEALAAASQRREAAGRIDPAPGLLFIAERLGLSPFERDTLLLCAAADLDHGLEPLIAGLQGGPSRAFPTFGLALRAIDDPTWDALSPHRPLRRARLLEINQPGATPLTAAALRADERIVNLLKGLNTLDERVAALVMPLGDAPDPAADGKGQTELAPSQAETVSSILERLRAAAMDAAIPPIQLVGVDPHTKMSVARALCAQLPRRLYRLGLDALPTARGEGELFARLWAREAALLPVALYVDADGGEPAAADHQAALSSLAGQALGLVFIGTREGLPAAGSGHGLAFEVDRPTPAEQHAAWKTLLGPAAPGEDADGAAKRLAGQFKLNLEDIRRAVALGPTLPGATPVADRVWDACRALTQPRLDALAQRLVPRATWDDLVLSAEAAAQLRQIAGQVRGRYHVYEEWGYARRMSRGLGISALFTGESGVGKTMAAEVIANELRLSLYRIDLSAVVSKYIGETEKNLRRLFDAAEQGGAILFFDEADALFGKRSEIKDSHDRYANIEINYLLQRMEAFSGLAILATNMKGALDGAFMRRLRFIVNFQFPGQAERRQIWEKALPPDVPREQIDYERLARFSLSGGNIHSAALNAAFLAAQRAVPVDGRLILTAVRSELRKLDKPFNEGEFR
jgi:hypothetical protein